jgi:hypothetical protein
MTDALKPSSLLAAKPVDVISVLAASSCSALVHHRWWASMRL